MVMSLSSVRNIQCQAVNGTFRRSTFIFSLPGLRTVSSTQIHNKNEIKGNSEGKRGELNRVNGRGARERF